jgi:RimJ/RimL family protein N-acetyltransferase
MTANLEVRLRVLTVDDAAWIVSTDAETTTAWAAPVGFEHRQLARELAAGEWASDDRWGWAIMVDGTPVGFVVVTDMATGDGSIQIRLRTSQRGRGVGRQVLRKLADHHFADNDELQRLVGTTHERNLAMQRAFNAAGFRMEAIHHDAATDAMGAPAATWGYALTRRDWELRRHHMDDEGYDLHGLSFTVDEVLDGPTVGSPGLTFTFLQDGARVTASFQSHLVSDGELAGIMHDDVLLYHYVQTFDPDMDDEPILGRGRLRVQRLADQRLQIINEWSDDDGRAGRAVLVQDPEPVNGAREWVPGPAAPVVTGAPAALVRADDRDEQGTDPALDDSAAKAS